MKISVKLLLLTMFLGMFVYAGCAKQEIVKKDESLAPSVTKQAGTASLNQSASTVKIPENTIATTNIKTSVIKSEELIKFQKASEPAKTADLQKDFEKIYFEFDSSSLSDTSRQTLAINFAVLKQNPQTRIRIEGHCDERGSDEYNLALGERRAQTAVRYLTTMGVQADRLSTISYGREKPDDPGHDETAWARNRRDEFNVSK